VVSNFDHFVTQWMSVVISMLGNEVSSSNVRVKSLSTSPKTRMFHSPGAYSGTSPTWRTGNRLVRY
jgi:hypothetical protein